MKRILLKSLSAEVETRLKDEITSGRLHPGSSISIADLAKQFGTSVTPVRDAVHKLASIGFVNVLPRKEIRVASLDRRKLRHVFDIRIALEGLAIREATKYIPGAALERAGQTLDQAEAKYASSADIADLLPHDSLIHDLIVEHCDNEMLITLMRGFHDLSSWAQQTVIRFEPLAVAKALPEHKQILAAMRARDAARAEKALREHLESSLERALAHLTE